MKREDGLAGTEDGTGCRSCFEWINAFLEKKDPLLFFVVCEVFLNFCCVNSKESNRWPSEPYTSPQSITRGDDCDDF